MRCSTPQCLLTVSLLSLGTLALIPSCADNNSSLFVVGVIGIDSSTCIAKPDSSAVLLSEGTLDFAFTNSYTAFILVGNQLTQRGSREQLRTETSRVSLRGAEVTLTKLDGTQLASYSTVGTGFVNSAAGDAPSYSAMAVNVIPPVLLSKDAPACPQTAGQICSIRGAGSVLAKIRVFGDTLGGTAVTSSELDFPITVCEGCLVRYPADAAAKPLSATDTYKCSTAATTATANTTVPPCVLGQDLPFTCTLCSSTVPLCHDPALNMSLLPTVP